MNQECDGTSKKESPDLTFFSSKEFLTKINSLRESLLSSHGALKNMENAIGNLQTAWRNYKDSVPPDSDTCTSGQPVNLTKITPPQ